MVGTGKWEDSIVLQSTATALRVCSDHCFQKLEKTELKSQEK